MEHDRTPAQNEPTDHWHKLFDWEEKSARMPGNERYELMYEPWTANGILWQLYRVWYNPDKNEDPSTLVGVEAVAGTYRVHTFSLHFVELLGEGDVMAGASVIAKELQTLSVASIASDQYLALPLFRHSALFRQQQAETLQNYTAQRNEENKQGNREET